MNTALNPAMGIAAIDFGTYLRSDAKHVYSLNLANKSLLECIDERVKQKERLHPSFGKNMSCLKANIRELENEYGCKIMPEHITQIFWEGFHDRLINQKQMSFATVETVSSQLRTTLEWAARYKAELSPDYADFDIPKGHSFLISLTSDDVSRIAHFDINTIHRNAQYLRTLERVRDQFVLQCNLGQRYSDISRLQPMHFNGNTFSIVQQKTGNKCFVPINTLSIDSRITFAILEKYGYHAPYTGDINNYNSYLHQLLHHIGEDFLEEVHIDNKINGQIPRETKLRYQLISSHSARRSFATINTLRNIPRNKILRATGHSSEKAFVRYICYDEES